MGGGDGQKEAEVTTDANLLTDCRRLLLERRRLLFERVARVEEDLRWFDTNVEIEALEEGQEEMIARLLSRLDERGKQEITEIDRAMAAMASGTYGRCVLCGEAIPSERLRALPAASSCVSCAAGGAT